MSVLLISIDLVDEIRVQFIDVEISQFTQVDLGTSSEKIDRAKEKNSLECQCVTTVRRSRDRPGL